MLFLIEAVSLQRRFLNRMENGAYAAGRKFPEFWNSRNFGDSQPFLQDIVGRPQPLTEFTRKPGSMQARHIFDTQFRGSQVLVTFHAGKSSANFALPAEYIRLANLVHPAAGSG